MLVVHLLKIKNSKIKKTGDTSYIYKNELDKAGFQHDMAYGDFKDINRRTASDKILWDKAFNIAKNPKYDGHQRDINFLIKSLQVVVLLIIIITIIIIIIIIIIINKIGIFWTWIRYN